MDERRVQEGTAMFDLGPARHAAAKDGSQARVGKHVLSEDNEGVMHVVLWNG